MVWGSNETALFCLWGLCSALHAHVNVHIDVLFSYGFMAFLCFSSICKLSYDSNRSAQISDDEMMGRIMVSQLQSGHTNPSPPPWPPFSSISQYLGHFWTNLCVLPMSKQRFIQLPVRIHPGTQAACGLFFPVRKWLFKMHPLFVCQTPKRIVRRTCNRCIAVTGTFL